MSLSPLLQQQLFDAATKVAQRNAITIQWSSFHTWSFFHQKPDSFIESDSINDFWAASTPFTNCVGQAFLAYQALRKTFSETPNLKAYVDNVKFMTSEKYAVTDQDYHALVTIELESYCIIVDTAMHPTAYKIRLGEDPFGCEPYIDTHNQLEQTFVEYAPVNGTNTITMRWKIIGGNWYSGVSRFSEMDPTAALRQLVAPASQCTKGNMPVNKIINTRVVSSEPPNNLPYTALNRGYEYMSSRLKIDFDERQFSLQIFAPDWLAKNAGYAGRVDASKITSYTDPKMGIIKLALKMSPNRDNARSVAATELLDEICEALGSRRGEILKIANSIYEVNPKILR
ncbi:hypothetical protein EJ04DRAFT_590478 [Polyplosphaeria fusca]|uniref:Uncharacterized protein n=1 Tax=Polyplosphaeria fusca TaxID=682080 RepID=A0A9P4V5T7_9PLEO|nr:hypothetical protein EJ04DRAFT_590478 [Polyplosphaeria fusca]